MIPVLITGAGGVTPRSVARGLREGALSNELRLIGVDSSEAAYSRAEGLFDAIIEVPSASDVRYREVITELIRLHSIEVALVIPEKEVLAWSEWESRPVMSRIPANSFCRAAGDKSLLNEILAPRGLAKPSVTYAAGELMSRFSTDTLRYPVWMRAHGIGTSSGVGAYCANSSVHASAWLQLNEHIQSWQITPFIQGRNIGVTVLFDRGEAKRVACFERLEYFMSNLTMSGVSGNTSRGRFVFDQLCIDSALTAVRSVEDFTGSRCDGLVTIDVLREATTVHVTEINLRPTAFVGAYSRTGLDFCTDWLALSADRNIGACQVLKEPPSGELLRDIDGTPRFSLETSG